MKDYKEYLKIVGGVSIISPLIYSYLRLEGLNNMESLLWVLLTLLIVFVFGALLYNYLEYGNYFEFKKKTKSK